MELTAAPSQPPPLSATTPATTTIVTTIATHTNSLESSPPSRKNTCNNDSTAAAVAGGGMTKLRLMCSYGGHIVPRPQGKSLCYLGGDTRIVVVDRHTTLSELTHRLAKTLLRSSTSSTTASFILKYQLPEEDLDSLISVTADEDMENMIDEYDRLNLSSDVNKPSRLRLFLFPSKPESVSSLLEVESTSKSDDWFLNALNGTSSGFSDTASVNCLLGLEEDVVIPEKKHVNNKSVIGNNERGNNPVQEVQSVPNSPMLETSSSFGSASSSPSLANLPPIRVNVDDQQKVGGGGIEEQFSQMNVHQKHLKHQEDVSFVSAPAPMGISVVPIASKVAITENQQQHQYQQKQSMSIELVSPDSVSSDGSVTNPLSRQKPSVIYLDPLTQTQCSTNINNRAHDDPSKIHDQNTRIQMQQQPQFIHTALPPPQQYIHHHHQSGAVPMTSYYQMYQPQSQHQQNFMYYIPTRQPLQGYNNLPLHTNASPATSAPKTQSPAAPVAPQLVQVPLSQNQYGYSHIHQPSQSVASSATISGGNYQSEFLDHSQQGKNIYYAARPQQSAAQYQTLTSTSPVETASHLQTNNIMKQQVRTSGP